jgi:hypothetical protein
MIGACPRPDQLMFAARSRQAPVVTVRGGRPGKNEQPRNTAGFTPSAITSPGQQHVPHRPEHPDKAGRRRAPSRSFQQQEVETMS